jgi:hypothetical protein
MCPQDTDGLPFPAKVNRSITPEVNKLVKIELELPFMIPDIVYKSQA